MRHLRGILILVFLFSFLQSWGASFVSQIGAGDLVIYMPSVNSFQSLSGELLARFYGPNFTQVLEDTKLTAQNSYGVDIYSDKDLLAIGVDVNRPLAFIHHSGGKGYLMLSLSSTDKFKQFVKRKYSKGLAYKVVGSVVYLSAQKEVLDGITNFLTRDKSFAYTLNKKQYKWNKPMVWLNGKYLSEMSAAEGITAHIDLPPGFTFITLDTVKDKLLLDVYSGSYSSRFLKYMRGMSKSGGKGKFDVLDFAWGHPAVIGHMRLDLPSLYRYLMTMDTLDITGVKSSLANLKSEFGIDLYRDMILNTDGRFKLVVNEFDTKRKKYDFYGTFGIKNKALAQGFMDSLKQAMLKSGAKLFSFEIFTNPVYHYKYKDIDLYFGTIEYDFFIASHKETMVRVVKNIFEDKMGYLDKLNPVIKEASRKNKMGFYYQIDIQSLLSVIKPAAFKFNPDILTGIKDILIYGYPDQDSSPYGWTTRISINFYQ